MTDRTPQADFDEFVPLSHLGRMSLNALRLLKMRSVILTPSYWRPFIQHRVLPTSEFDSLPFLPSFGTILDVGANRGQFGLFASHRFHAATIHMFEPVASSAAIAASVVPQAELHQVALGAADGQIEFYVHPRSDQSSGYPVAGAQSSRVQVSRLDGLGLKVERPCLLKMDVQGMELQVLEGADGLLPLVDQVLCEVSTPGHIVGGASIDDTVSLLGHRGFATMAAGPLLPYGTDLLFQRVAQRG